MLNLHCWIFLECFFSKLILIGVQLFYNVVLVSTAEQNESAAHIHVFPSFWTSFPLGHHRALNRAPWAIQCLLLSYPFCAQYQQCILINPSLPIPPTHPFPPWYPYVCSINGVAKWCGEFVATCLLTNDFGMWPCSSESLNPPLTKVKPAWMSFFP